MHPPEHAVTLAPEEIQALNTQLSDVRHNVNNHLALVTAVAELLHRKPEMAERLSSSLAEAPEKIAREIRRFSDEFERVMQMKP